MKKKVIHNLVNEAQEFCEAMSKNRTKKKGARVPPLEMFPGRPDLDDAYTTGILDEFRIALEKDVAGGSQAAADLLMKINLIFGKVPKEQRGGLVLALAAGAELMIYATMNPENTVTVAVNGLAERMEHCRNIAPGGGGNTGYKKWEDCVAKIRAYKKKHPKHSAKTAERNVANEIGYENPRKLGERVERRTGKIFEAFYSTLK